MKQMYFLIIVLICLFVLAGCSQNSPKSKKVLSYQENSEIIGEEKEEIIGEISDTMYESIDRSNAEAEEIVIGHSQEREKKLLHRKADTALV